MLISTREELECYFDKYPPDINFDCDFDKPGSRLFAVTGPGFQLTPEAQAIITSGYFVLFLLLKEQRRSIDRIDKITNDMRRRLSPLYWIKHLFRRG